MNAAFGTNKTAAVSGRDPNAVVARHATVDDAEDDIDDDALRTATKRAKLTLFSHQNDVGVTQMTASSTPAEPAAAVKATSKSTTAHDDVNDGLDALDAFMANVEKDVEKIRENDAKLLAELAAAEEHGARAAEAALEDGQVGNNNNNDMSDDEDEDGNVGAASDLLA